MALTWTVQQDGDDVWGKERFRYMKGVAAAADYPTGGYPFTPATFGLTVITYVEVVSGPLGWASQIDTVNNKLMVNGGSASGVVAGQAPAATDFSTAQPFIVRVFGR